MPILFVLESPGKVKNVQKYIGDDYIVASSVGHIRTLGTDREIGIDVSNNFAPTYLVDPKKADVVSKLKSQARKCDMVYLAADWDREGEAIAWHIKQTLGLADGEYKRIVFRQITQPAILEALENPVDLDMNMVNSQQARMVLDKLIGYKVSPCLWKEFKNYTLSAGRVQSVAVRLIVEREQEIAGFVSSTYYRPLATFSLNPEKINPKRPDIRAECDQDIKDVNEVSNIINNTDSGLAVYRIADLKETRTKRRPPAPFITSSLQQEASNKLGMSPDACMSAAQKLYEAGLITYMRTDSYVLSQDAIRNIGAYVTATYGQEYHHVQQYTKKAKGAQEAHEAIRPTDVRELTGGTKVGPRENKLYQMIWRRTVACQMSPADVEIKTVKIEMDTVDPGFLAQGPGIDVHLNLRAPTAGAMGLNYRVDDTGACNPKVKGRPTFSAKCEKVLFDGYLRVYTYGADGQAADDDKDGAGEDGVVGGSESARLEALFAKLEVGQQVWCASMKADERQTKPPNGRFTEASLIKKLEDAKIGRPSTYASIVTKIKDKLYVERKSVDAVPKEFRVLGFEYPNKLTVTNEVRKVDGEKNKLFPTGLGTMICGYLTKNFAQLMDYTFTADVEEKLDNIAGGTIEWYKVVGAVWDYLHPIIDQLGAMISAGAGKVGKRVLGAHPDSGLEICVIKTRYGWSICEENLEDKKLSRWASIGAKDPDTLDLAGALAMLVWPKQLGTHKGHPVELCRAKSVYIKHNGKNYSIDIYNKTVAGNAAPAAKRGRGKKAIGDSEDDATEAKHANAKALAMMISNPEATTLADAIRVIDATETQRADNATRQQDTHTFEGVTDYKVLNGQYGYYVKYLETYNVPLPPAYKKDISELTKEIAEAAIQKFLGKKGSSAAAAKTTKTTAAKKKTTASTSDGEPKKRGRKPKADE
jgi:DNA topoisomerase-1